MFIVNMAILKIYNLNLNNVEFMYWSNESQIHITLQVTSFKVIVIKGVFESTIKINSIYQLTLVLYIFVLGVC